MYVYIYIYKNCIYYVPRGCEWQLELIHGQLLWLQDGFRLKVDL